MMSIETVDLRKLIKFLLAKERSVNMDIAIIPAYNPDEKLVELIKDMRERGLNDIIVVNDGSIEETNSIFQQIDEYATVITHSINRGKGAAIKTAFQFLLNKLADIQGIVILDADGQHRPEDAIRLLNEVHNKESGLVLGVRYFEGKIPFRSLFGNTVTKYVFRIFSGKWVSDTQTGLRAFTPDLVSKLLKVSGDRYEYEMNVLLACAKDGTFLTEVPIATIYHDESNSCSHFRTIRDSVRIYGNILAFSGASFLSFLLDYILFFLFFRIFDLSFAQETTLILANIGARFVSAAFNYYLNSTFIFGIKEKRLKSILGYIALACSILIMNTAILYFMHDYLGLNKALAKLLTEMILFIVSYTVQKFLIFNHIRKKEVVTL